MENKQSPLPLKIDNELIAEFMGGAWKTVYIGGVEHKQFYMPDDHITESRNVLTDLPYDTSWEWLMPVVEKIGLLYIKREDGSTLLFSRISVHIETSGYWQSTGQGAFSCSILGRITKCLNNEVINTNFHKYEEIDVPHISVRSKSKIDAVYKAVVSFIKWYNEQSALNPQKA
jgi:hypothetical protein